VLGRVESNVTFTLPLVLCMSNPQVQLMEVLGCGLAALDIHKGIPELANVGRMFLSNLSLNAANLPTLRAACVKELMIRILALHPSHPAIAERAPQLIARL
jgi:hypothetical protein